MYHKNESELEQGAFTLVAESADHGKRLDFFVAERIGDLTRSFVSELVKNGHIHVNNQQKKTSYKIKSGDHVTGITPATKPINFTPEPIDLQILHEDDDIIVINKQPGLVVHPAPGNWSGTLVNGLLHHCPAIAGTGEEIRPGIVHRLDRDTTGVMVVAKNRKAHYALSEAFKSRTVIKEYTAVVYGTVKGNKGIITLPVGRHPVNRKKMSTNSPVGRNAETHWHVTERFLYGTQLSFDIKTGRTHQIRVHCQAMNHPIIGDPLYSGKKGGVSKQFGNKLSLLVKHISRQMLHAKRLEFYHPASLERVSFQAPVPHDMNLLISALRESV